MNRKRLLLDLDSVLNDFVQSLCCSYNQNLEDCESTVNLSDITDWDLNNSFKKPSWELRGEKYDILKEIALKNNFFKTVPVKEGAVWATKELSRYVDLYVVSASHFSTVADKAEWLLSNFPHIPIKNFIPCYDKSLIKADGLVDDGLHNLYNFEGKKFLFDRPWNHERTALGYDYIKIYEWNKTSVDIILQELLA